MSILTLPNELIQTIAQFGGLHTCLTLSHVCQTWRTVFNNETLVNHIRAYRQTFGKSIELIKLTIDTFTNTSALLRAQSLTIHDSCCNTRPTKLEEVLDLLNISRKRCFMKVFYDINERIHQTKKEVLATVPPAERLSYVRPGPLYMTTAAECLPILDQWPAFDMSFTKCSKHRGDTRQHVETQFHRSFLKTSLAFQRFLVYYQNLRTHPAPPDCFR